MAGSEYLARQSVIKLGGGGGDSYEVGYRTLGTGPGDVAGTRSLP